MKPSDLFSKEFISVIEKNLLGHSLEETEQEIEYIDPRVLLNANRIDLVCKLYYIECRENGVGIDFAKEIYTEHIKAITRGRCQELWNPDKNGIDIYISRFDSLIDDIKRNGFDTNKSVVPISTDNGILDGAHRTAIAIYFGLPLPVFRLQVRSWNNSFKRFQGEGVDKLPQKYLDFCAYLYTKYKAPCYIALIWPVSQKSQNYDIALKIINECCSVVYMKQVMLNYNGLTQLAIHTYMEAEWAGGFEKNFPGIPSVVNERYAPNNKVTVILLDDASLEEIQQLKKIVRIVLGGGFCRIHITDTQMEAIRLGKMLFNENSISFLNQSYIMRYPNFIRTFLQFRKEVLNREVQDNVCIDTGGVMAAYGLRDTNDIDYLSIMNIDLQGFDRHTQTYYNRFSPNIHIDSIIYNWFEHFYCFDIMFNCIHNVKTLKSSRGEAKDHNDIKLIERMKTDCPYEKKWISAKRSALHKKIKKTIWRYLYSSSKIVRKVTGEKTYQRLKGIVWNGRSK